MSFTKASFSDSTDISERLWTHCMNLSIEENVKHTWMEASIRSRGFWIHSSHRFSLEPVLEVAAELASEVAEDWAAKLEIAPKGPEK